MYEKNVRNFVHLYDNNRLILIGLNEMLPGQQPFMQIYVDSYTLLSSSFKVSTLYIFIYTKTQVIHF